MTGKQVKHKNYFYYWWLVYLCTCILSVLFRKIDLGLYHRGFFFKNLINIKQRWSADAVQFPYNIDLCPDIHWFSILPWLIKLNQHSFMFRESIIGILCRRNSGKNMMISVNCMQQGLQIFLEREIVLKSDTFNGAGFKCFSGEK